MAWSQSSHNSIQLPRVSRKNVNIIERKAFFMHTPTKTMKGTMRHYYQQVKKLFDSQDKDACRLHPNPPVLANGHGARSIRRNFSWKDGSSGARQQLGVNFGILALILKARLTHAQKQGWIHEKWELSHLCGNWTCCNWRHMTVESGHDNLARNGSCFSKRKRLLRLAPKVICGKCVQHSPPCLPRKKLPLQSLLPKQHEASSSQTSASSRGTRHGHSILGYSSAAEVSSQSADSSDDLLPFEYHC